ncbi:hypothetical protein K461DRAFT_102593 [Myriangium duriaei CBS 260.36]|uniref:Uncharacterized protein n=1 Tax=Myriangium duriaei CBS 260.36 TaxID=1168546 RepID=A0A9P4J7F2_9PEZI|nr:hypothetical protein K461DRAFT_102593 [Myriangium duriaei CBS 260.36]
MLIQIYEALTPQLSLRGFHNLISCFINPVLFPLPCVVLVAGPGLVNSDSTIPSEEIWFCYRRSHPNGSGPCTLPYCQLNRRGA